MEHHFQEFFDGDENGTNGAQQCGTQSAGDENEEDFQLQASAAEEQGFIFFDVQNSAWKSKVITGQKLRCHPVCY